jgi:hypothetical protein
MGWRGKYLTRRISQSEKSLVSVRKILESIESFMIPWVVV